jgi:hypothetical protein
MLCLPYREPRLDWWQELPPPQMLPWWRIHLLGVSTLEEAKAWGKIARAEEELTFTIDTGKPLKAAIVGRRLDDGRSLRSIPVSSKDLLNLTDLTDDQIGYTTTNIALLRGILNDGE